MAVMRIDIERALNEIVCRKEGMRFFGGGWHSCSEKDVGPSSLLDSAKKIMALMLTRPQLTVLLGENEEHQTPFGAVQKSFYCYCRMNES